jgi:diguanylate cyclase (GGDEF)-like protein/PAS domain S-box-containing protein
LSDATRFAIRSAVRLRRRFGMATSERSGSFLLAFWLGVQLCVYAAWQLFRFGPAGSRSVVGDLFFVPLSALAVWAAWRASRRCRASPLLRRAWRLIALGWAFWAAGNLTQTVYEAVGAVPFPSIADVFYLAFIPLTLAGLLSFPSAIRDRGERVRQWLDITVVALAGTAVVILVVLGDALTAHTSGVLKAVSVAYPVGHAVLLFGVGSLLLRGTVPSAGRSLFLLSFALGLYVVGGLVYGYVSVHGGYRGGDPVDSFYVVAVSLFVLAAAAQEPAKQAERVLVSNERRNRLLLGAAGAGLTALVYTHYRDRLFPELAVMIVVVAMAAVALVRQFLAREDLLRASLLLDGERRRYREIVETANEGVFTVDQTYQTTLVNRKLADMLGYEPEEMLGRPLSDFIASAATQDAQHAIGLIEEGVSVQIELPLRARDSREVWTLVSASPLLDEKGSISGALAMISDISDRRALEKRLRDLADRDPLTGIYNRRYLIEELDRRLCYARRYRRPGAVLTFDLDNFKFANDTQGHATGDAMLKSVAAILTARARDTDVVARLGGDEFAVLLSETTEEGALRFASEARSLLCGHKIAPLIVTSIGVATFAGEEEITPDEILVCADIALYEAKERGGDRAGLYTGQASGALTWVQRIRTALAEGRFVLYGQPIFDLRSGLVDRHELLVRMLTEDGDIVRPGSFIPTAERFGLIGELDSWVLHEGLRLALAGERVSINLSGPSIGERRIIAAVDHAIAAGLRPGAVVLEVTETAAMKDMTAARLFAGKLCSIGCELAIDDFGTGFGSFFSLKQLPARYVKIDMEFVRNIATNHADRQIIRSMIDVAHSLDKLAIAEGVEDAETLAVLRELGTDYAQGFHLGRPQRLSPPTTIERTRSLTAASACSSSSHDAARAPASGTGGLAASLGSILRMPPP